MTTTGGSFCTGIEEILRIYQSTKTIGMIGANREKEVFWKIHSMRGWHLSFGYYLPFPTG